MWRERVALYLTVSQHFKAAGNVNIGVVTCVWVEELRSFKADQFSSDLMYIRKNKPLSVIFITSVSFTIILLSTVSTLISLCVCLCVCALVVFHEGRL